MLNLHFFGKRQKANNLFLIKRKHGMFIAFLQRASYQHLGFCRLKLEWKTLIIQKKNNVEQF